MGKQWKDAADDCHYYYNEENGRIIGQVNKIAFTKVFISKVIHNHNDETFLGQFISCEFAQKSVQLYWDIEDRTLIE
jgi:hypothetical protein